MKKLAAAMIVMGLAALASGCGGGSSNSSGSTPNNGISRAATTTLQNTTTSSSSPSFASAQNCRDLAGIAAKAAAAVEASGNSSATLQTEANELHALAQAAPSDIKGDFQTFATAFTGFIHAVQSSGYKIGSKTPPTAAQIAAFTTAAKAFNTAKLKQAEQHLSAWAHQNCKGFGG